VIPPTAVGGLRCGKGMVLLVSKEMLIVVVK
jgi:hypothetical protein